MSLDNIAIDIRLRAVLNLANDFSTASAPLDITRSVPMSTGTGTNQADKIFYDQRTLAASATEDLDLAGVLTDPLGSTLTFARIKGMFIYAATSNTNNVVVGNGTNPFINWISAATSTISVGPGGLFALFRPDSTGYAVTAGTGDILKITNSAGSTSVTYDVVLIGSSA